MKKTSDVQWVERSVGKVVCLGVAGVAAIFAALAIGYALFDNQLVAGPGFVVSAPSANPDALGVTRITPVEMDHTVLRVAWNFASALFMFGIMILGGVGFRVLRNLDEAPLFSKKTSTTISNAATGSLLLIGIGGVVRWFLEGRIGTELQLETVDFSDDDFSLFIFDIPFLALIFLVNGIGWVWRRGEALQREAEATI